jgi:branched-subunit amino acid aminotransferase/4-amino-4-deoxychorismate lyase
MSRVPPIWLNGRLLPGEEPRIRASDRGFLLGDGIFETIRAHGHRPLWLADHLARLRAGADLLGIPVPLGDDAIEEGLGSLLAVSDYEKSALRLTLSRGPSGRRGLWPPDDPASPTCLATVARLPPARARLRLAVATCTRRNEHSPLSRVKSLNYGDNLLARREAAGRGLDDALMLNSRGSVACGTVGSFFLRVSGRWRTPPVADGALPGLARRHLLSILDVEEKKIAREDLLLADAAFLSNSLGIAGIQEIDGRLLHDTTTLLEKIPLFGDPAGTGAS